MRRILPFLALALLAAACAGPQARVARRASEAVPAGKERIFRNGSSPQLLADAEAKASPAGAKVLAQARVMTVDNGEILPGACWDYVNAAWTRAGYPSSKRRNAFKSKKAGPYAGPADIQPGDWVYFINHSYGDIEHSALFVDWADRDARRAYMLSYAGEKRRETARYLLYDLRSAYQVVRAKD